ncbi:hypothetical protein AGMMS50268_20440 [Spirochaetia bacterium]|nr:hypothetical protein AGMMS50268_20440 [Spirochaetia bacterium]
MKYIKQTINNPSDTSIPVIKNTGYIVRNNPSIGLIIPEINAFIFVFTIISKTVSGYRANKFTSK